MSSTLTEFLRENSKRYAEEAECNKAMIAEWQRAVQELFTEIKNWIAGSDPEKIIDVSEKTIEITEPGLGRYFIPRLELRAFGTWIGIIPKARSTIATAKPTQKSLPQRATGRVDITDEVKRYVLLRLPEGTRVSWYIDDLVSGSPRPLSRESFEAALLSYFK